MAATSPYLVCIPARGANSSSQELYARTVALGALTVVELSVGAPFIKLGLARFKVKRVAGTAATFTPYLFSNSGVTTPGDIAQEYAGTATAVATLFDPSLGDAVVWMQADANGKLYMVLAPNAGTDNTFDVCLRFLKAE
jgi:hypothetical protein